MKNHNNGFLIVIILLFISTIVSAQNVGVDKLSGSVSYSVPIWNVTSENLSFPVVLSYASQGLKVGQGSGKAGMGWNITNGGSITRVLKGLPDDLSRTDKIGWLHGAASSVQNFSPTADENYLTHTDEYADFDGLKAFNGFDSTNIIKDTEPDIFYINAPGVSGMFVFDSNGKAIFSPFNDASIEYFTTGGKITRFKLKTKSGTTYDFTLTTKIKINVECDDESKIVIDKNGYYNFKENNDDEIEFTTTWYLTSISSVQGGVIGLNYKQNYYSDQYARYHISTWAPYRTDTVFLHTYDEVSDSYQKIEQFRFKYEEEQPYSLTEIVGENHKVKFIDGLHAIPVEFVPNSDNRFSPPPLRIPLVDQVEIYENVTGNDRIVTKVKMTYEFFKSSEFLPSDEVRSMFPFLVSVKKLDGWYENQPVTFDYYNVKLDSQMVFLPQNDSFSRDYYGYFNNSNRYESLPHIYVYPDETEAERYRPTPIPDYNGTFYELSGSDKQPDARRLQSGMLKTINMPTGGHTEIEYEPNYYYDALSQQNEYGGGLRVRSITTVDGVNHDNNMTFRYDYNLANGNSSGKQISRPQYAYTLGVHVDPADTSLHYFDEFSTDSNELIWKKITLRDTDNISWDPVNGNLGVNYSKVTVYQTGIGKTIDEFDIPLNYGTINTGNWNTTKTRAARQNPGQSSVVSFGPLLTRYNYPFAPQTSHNYLNGALLKSSVLNEQGDTLRTVSNSYSYYPTYQAIQGISKNLIQRDANKDFFIYSPYEIRLMTTPVLTASVSFAYENGQKMTSTATYNYTTTGTPYLLDETLVDVENNTYKTYYKYNHQYQVVSGSTDPLVTAIEKLDALGIEGLPIETRSSIKLSGGTEKVSGASLSNYNFINGDKLVMAGSETLRLNTPVSDFIISTIDLPSKTFSRDPRYERLSFVTSTDSYANVNSIEDRNKQLATTLYGYSGKLPILTATGVKAEGIAFNNFERNSLNVLQENDHEFALSAGHSNYLVTGRVAGNALQLSAGGGNNLSKSVSKLAPHKEYLLSAWIFATVSGSLTITCDDGTNQSTANIDFTANSAWSYYEVTVDVSALNNNFIATLSSDLTVKIDDLLFYPRASQFSYTTYNADLLTAAETNHFGRSTYYEYDIAKRPVIVRDYENNIVSRNSYTNNAVTGVGGVYPTISFEGNVYTSEPKEFAVLNIGDPSNAVFYWKVDPLVNNPEYDNEATYNGITPVLGSNISQLTIADDTLDYLVMCKIVMDGQTYYAKAQLTDEYTKIGTFRIDICIEGPTRFDLCGIESNSSFNCNTGISGSADVKFKAEAPEATGAVTYKWYWLDAPGASIQDAYNPPVQTGPEYTFNSNQAAGDFYLICLVEGDNGKERSHVFIDYYNSDPTCPIE